MNSDTFALTDLPERMRSKITVENDCWIWAGAKNNRGYGSVSNGRKSGSMLAHRKSYAMTKGEIPDGLQIDHLCENTSCVNPAHLEAVTQEEHMRRVGHKDLAPIYSDSALSAYVPKSKPGPESEWLRSILERLDAMTPEERAEDDARRHAMHLRLGVRCACRKEAV